MAAQRPAAEFLLKQTRSAKVWQSLKPSNTGAMPRDYSEGCIRLRVLARRLLVIYFSGAAVRPLFSSLPDYRPNLVCSLLAVEKASNIKLDAEYSFLIIQVAGRNNEKGTNPAFVEPMSGYSLGVISDRHSFRTHQAYTVAANAGKVLPCVSVQNMEERPGGQEISGEFKAFLVMICGWLQFRRFRLMCLTQATIMIRHRKSVFSSQ